MSRLIRTPEGAEIDNNLLKRLRKGEILAKCYSYDNYFITNTGRLFSGKETLEFTTIDKKKYYTICWREIKSRVIRGYLAVNITYKEFGRMQRKTEYIHRLVYEAFNGPVDTNMLRIVHKDEDKLNNNLKNLGVEFRRKSKEEVFIFTKRVK